LGTKINPRVGSKGRTGGHQNLPHPELPQTQFLAMRTVTRTSYRNKKEGKNRTETFSNNCAHKIRSADPPASGKGGGKTEVGKKGREICSITSGGLKKSAVRSRRQRSRGGEKFLTLF